MSEKRRDNFCKVRPREGSGSASYRSGLLTVECTPDQPAEVTCAEWEHLLKPTGFFELVPKTEGE
jgi:hypothetical protein